LEGWTLAEGPVLEKGVTGMRSYVAEPMRFGRLFLAGDAAHIVPPTGAKGLNLALHDVRLLAEALVAWFGAGSSELLDGYSDACRRGVWRAALFWWWLRSTPPRSAPAEGSASPLQLRQPRSVPPPPPAATSLAENYVGIDRL